MAKGRTRRGRPAKAVPRYPGGKIRREASVKRGETEGQIMATALAYRRKLVAARDAARPEAGYVLGRLYLEGVITAREHRAGFEFSRLIHDYMTSQGYPSPFPQSMEIGAAHGLSLGEELDADKLRRTANQYMRVQTVLSDTGKAVRSMVWEVCVYDEAPHILPDLVTGLRAIADFFQIPLDTQAR